MPDPILPNSCAGYDENSCLLAQCIAEDVLPEGLCSGCGLRLDSMHSTVTNALRSARLRETDKGEEDTVARLVKGVLPAPMSQPAPPNQLGPYEIIERIGGGAMGTVYLGRHVHLQTNCAIKILKVTREEGSRTVERFQREMRALGRMDHPHVV